MGCFIFCSKLYLKECLLRCYIISRWIINAILKDFQEIVTVKINVIHWRRYKHISGRSGDSIEDVIKYAIRNAIETIIEDGIEYAIKNNFGDAVQDDIIGHSLGSLGHYSRWV